MKKLFALFLALLMAATTTAAFAELDPMTDEEITLVFGSWDLGDDDYKAVLQRSIDAFMEAYPNITVELMPMSSATLFADLQNMASATTMPDVYITTSVPRAVQNGWALDVTEYLDNDPDAAALMSGFRNHAKISGRDFAIAAYCYPYICIVNTTMIEKYNLDIPEADWTWDDYVALAEDLAHYEDYNFGMGGHQLYRWYLALMESQSSYGWDGESYHFSEAWVDSILLQQEWFEEYICEHFETAEDKIAALGSNDVWIPGTGVIGLFTDYSWGAKPFLTFYAKKTAQNFVLYPQPLGETEHAMAAVDYCVVSPASEYPREAYELSKWIVWGEQACMDRVNYYEENNITYIPWQPVISTQPVWDAFAARSNEKIKIYDSQRDYIPEATYVAPGYSELQTWLDENGIVEGISTGSIDGYAMLDELNKVAQDILDEYYANLILD